MHVSCISIRQRRCSSWATSPRAGIKVSGTIEYCPATIRRPYVNGRLVSGQIEFPPEHAAVLVEEIAPDGYTRGVPVVREGKALQGHSGRAEPSKAGDRAGGLDLVYHHRRLAIRTAKLLPEIGRAS